MDFVNDRLNTTNIDRLFEFHVVLEEIRSVSNEELTKVQVSTCHSFIVENSEPLRKNRSFSLPVRKYCNSKIFFSKV